MSNAVVVYTKPEEVRTEFSALQPALMEVMPAGVDPDRFVRLVVGTIIANPKLMACTRDSLLRSVRDAASLGLVPTGLLGSAYIVPYKNKRTGRQEAQLIPGYRGLIDLARRSGEILDITADLIRARDTYRVVKGTDGRVEHEPFIPDPTLPAEQRDPGPFVGAYMIAWLKGNPKPHVEWMTYDEIEVVRRSSRASDDGPWVAHWGEMARKTVVRRGSKYLPLTPDFERALSMDEEAERSAAPPDSTAPATLTPAQRLLRDRIEARQVDPETGEIDGDTADADVAAEGQQDGQQDASDGEAATSATTGQGTAPEPPTAGGGDATAVCGDVNPDLGACTRAPGHPGGHKNEAGVWPARKES